MSKFGGLGSCCGDVRHQGVMIHERSHTASHHGNTAENATLRGSPTSHAAPQYDRGRPNGNALSIEDLTSIAVFDNARRLEHNAVSPHGTDRLRRLFVYLTGISEAHHWLWCIAIIAVIAVVFYTIQCLTMAPSRVWQNIGFFVLVCGIVCIMILEQGISAYTRHRRVKAGELIISVFIMLCSLIGWILWSFRHKQPLYNSIGDYMFYLIDVVAFTHVASRNLHTNSGGDTQLKTARTGEQSRFVPNHDSPYELTTHSTTLGDGPSQIPRPQAAYCPYGYCTSSSIQQSWCGRPIQGPASVRNPAIVRKPIPTRKPSHTPQPLITPSAASSSTAYTLPATRTPKRPRSA